LVGDVDAEVLGDGEADGVGAGLGATALAPLPARP
jgi:hypothetical protein